MTAGHYRRRVRSASHGITGAILGFVLGFPLGGFSALLVWLAIGPR